MGKKISNLFISMLAISSSALLSANIPSNFNSFDYSNNSNIPDSKKHKAKIKKAKAKRNRKR